MPFWDRSDARIPDKIRNLSPEEMERMVDFYTANKDKIGTLETEAATSKQEREALAAQLAEGKTKIEQMEAFIASVNAAAPKKEPEAPSEPDWYTDPEAKTMRMLQPILAFQYQQAAINARRSLDDWVRDNPGKYNDNAKIFKKYKSEIYEIMSKERPENQANERVWQAAFNLVKGNHDDEISEARKNSDGEFFGEAPSKAGSPEPPKADVVDDTARASASRWGVSPEEVMASRKSLTFGGEPAKGF